MLRTRAPWCLLVALLLCGRVCDARAAVNTLGLAPQTTRCAHVELSADEAQCSTTMCRLEGHSQLRCDDLTLWADRIDVLINADQTFAGAVAEGSVLLVEGLKVVRCRAMLLEQDRVQGRIDGTTLEVRRSAQGAGPADPNGVPGGRNQAVLHGNVQRLDRDHIRITDGDFTLCDCGEGHLPSWRFDAAEIDAVLGERATIWWPQLRVSLGDAAMLPVTPPLLPLSLPLARRAPGLLPPQVSFLGGALPTVDLPFFWPLGDGWDLTLSPGTRMDWRGARGAQQAGAPRLGVRLRYAPAAGTAGEMRFQLTHDGAHGM
ncbi:MAG TPA: hypothetical protein VFH51_04410, partial [Myxococcota bacterium]|nr:hypothetical protein [Myxococcota bacterium]